MLMNLSPLFICFPVWLTLKAAEVFMSKGWWIDGRKHGEPLEILHTCTCACISVYVMWLWVAAGRWGSLIRSETCYSVCIVVALNRDGIGFVNHSECSSLQEVPDVTSLQQQKLSEKWQIDFQIVSSVGSQCITVPDKPNSSGIRG